MDLLRRHAAAAAFAGALAIAFSSILFRLSGASPSTGAFFRCLYALPALWLVSAMEGRRYGARPVLMQRAALVAGGFFAVDLLLWHHAIEAIGAGLATVLGNLQVLIVGLAAWIVFGERPARSYLTAAPAVFVGVVLISGVIGHGAYGSAPALGALLGAVAGVAYTGFLLALRHGNTDLRRPAGPLFVATLTATVAVAISDVVTRDLSFVPAWPSHGWLLLLALQSQVLGWLLISVSLPRLPAALTSVILTTQPLGSLGLAALIFGESPSPLQLTGAVLILAGLVTVTMRSPARPVGGADVPDRQREIAAVAR